MTAFDLKDKLIYYPKKIYTTDETYKENIFHNHFYFF